MILLSHPTGNTFVSSVLAALDTRDLLARYYTTLWQNHEQQSCPFWLSWVSAHQRSVSIASAKLFGRPLRELVRLLASHTSLLSPLVRHERGWASVDAVYQDLDGWVARQLETSGARAAYAYEDGALNTFRAAHEQGLACIYDLPICYWRFVHTLFREEMERLPQWEPTLVGTRDSEAKLARKDEELHLADAIVVPSHFVRESLPEWVGNKPVCVAEFGSPAVVIDPILDAERTDALRAGKPLRVLFAGSMTQRKGLADVFAAMRLLNRSDVELIVMGSPIASMEFYRKEYDRFRYEPTRPHQEVLKLMQSCHVLVLPSIAEGRALVQQEAMSCGMPIIVTPNAGGEDLIDEGKTGFLIPIREPEMIAERIAWFADHRSLWPDLGRTARAKAADYGWESYGSKVVNFIKEVVSL